MGPGIGSVRSRSGAGSVVGGVRGWTAVRVLYLFFYFVEVVYTTSEMKR